MSGVSGQRSVVTRGECVTHHPWKVARLVAAILECTVIGLPAAAIAAGTNATPAWPIFHGDAALSGVADTALPDKLSVVWRFRAGEAVSAAPVVGGDMIYFVTEGGRLYAISLQGRKIWARVTGDERAAATNRTRQAARFVTPPLFVRDTVLAGADDGCLHALESTTGKTRWKYKAGESIHSTANWVEVDGERGCGIVVISQENGIVHCVDLASGKARWTSPPVERCDASPGVGSNFIAFGSCAAALHFVSAAKGEMLATLALGADGQVAGGVAVSGDQVFAGTLGGMIVCADVKKGIVWTNQIAKGEAFATPAVTADRVVAGANDGFVYCLDRADGRKLWSFEAGDSVLSPVVAGDRVVVSAGGSLFILRLKDGGKLWAAKPGDLITSPAVADGKVIVGADDGYVAVYGEAVPARHPRE